MYKKILLTFMILTLGISIMGCTKTEPLGETTTELQTLTIGVMPDVDSIPFIIAQKKGYFKEEGLTVKIEHFKSAMDRDTALQTGNIDGAISDMLAVIFLNDHDFDVKITSKTNGSFKMVAAKDSNIQTMSDTKERSIGISTNTIIDYLTDKLLESADIDPSSPEKIAIPKIPTRLEMLGNGKIDMATLPEPLASVAAFKGGRILSSSDKQNIHPGIMLFTGEAITSKNKEIKALYNAYNKSIDYLNKEPMENYIEVLIAEAGFPEIIKDTLTLPDYNKASMPASEDFDQVLTWLKSKELTESDYTLDTLWDDSFIK